MTSFIFTSLNVQIMQKRLLATLILISLFISPFAQAEIKDQVAVDKFINKMVEQHEFDHAELVTLFQSVEVKPKIIAAMTRPAEGMPWYKYRKIFIRDSRIQGGVKFWQDNLISLTTMQKIYGLPEEIIIAIIGVETLYGKRTGGHRVIDALATLGFEYPKRSAFFLSELEQFLLLCREEQMNPLEPVGSYAGAMGMPQFMPSSYRNFAADYEGDVKRDIWNNPSDAIASVANYFVKHHWQPGKDIAFPVKAKGEQYKQALSKGLKPDMNAAQLKALRIQLPEQIADDEPLKLLSFEQQKGQDLWVGLENFYVITRYNHSALYALAVLQLSQAIKQQYIITTNE
ncbi:membrane-bound lytic murein transglycosylase B [Bathymodiolus platifrons methanotrophic gill symbiont]|uniref:lytic murein transglycosylase B n=1 Tax=Bathymodiolus platifrons methanotrophic gill symbiont TaxID=113268 RepID=UPI000B67072A|nr:lytic murein transglycosylase B [Bathymodiolus platifrons methanotrophic gill symbiont]GAW87113.1 membrane-bound lytic murein transglycosylase B [Bathymodiolus platifrons methanotrophic gill symbiont]GFO77071.1 membrane-bound lytic murein transglycosylase B [Bathymodiolus platifrons methanotrophic gill symbiont]